MNDSNNRKNSFAIFPILRLIFHFFKKMKKRAHNFYLKKLYFSNKNTELYDRKVSLFYPQAHNFYKIEQSSIL